MKLQKIIALGIAFIPTASFASPTLNGAGATLPAPFYSRIFNDYFRDTGKRVNYQSTGSGAGIRQFIAGTVDFAASDEPISSKDASKIKRGFIQIPLTGSTIAIAYNKPGCNLKLTQKQTVNIFNGKIKDWKELNCPSGPISVVHRSDGSGTTFVFTSSLKEFGGWEFGAAKSVNWPTGIGAKGNEGVSAIISKKPGTIGYLSYSFVKGTKIQSASLQNKSGQYVQPTYKNGSAALNGLKVDPVTLAGEDFNSSVKNAYPISTLTWVLAYKKGYGEKAKEVKSALNYALSGKVQMIADDLGYIPLSGSLLNQARLKVSQISQ